MKQPTLPFSNEFSTQPLPWLCPSPILSWSYRCHWMYAWFDSPSLALTPTKPLDLKLIYLNPMIGSTIHLWQHSFLNNRPPAIQVHPSIPFIRLTSSSPTCPHLCYHHLWLCTPSSQSCAPYTYDLFASIYNSFKRLEYVPKLPPWPLQPRRRHHQLPIHMR